MRNVYNPKRENVVIDRCRRLELSGFVLISFGNEVSKYERLDWRVMRCSVIPRGVQRRAVTPGAKILGAPKSTDWFIWSLSLVIIPFKLQNGLCMQMLVLLFLFFIQNVTVNKIPFWWVKITKKIGPFCGPEIFAKVTIIEVRLNVFCHWCATACWHTRSRNGLN